MIKMVPQNLENKLTSFYFSKAFLSGLIRRSYEGSLFREYKNKIDKSEKVVRKWKDSNLKNFILFVEGYLKLFYYNRWLKII